MTQEPKQVEVIQSDRDAAYRFRLYTSSLPETDYRAKELHDLICNGCWDEKEVVQAFARHRLTSQPAVADVEELREDVAFLLARSGHAGKATFGGKRWTGVSSNALVAIAFGENDSSLPSDSADLAACYRAVQRLPAHRRVDAVFDQLEAGERHVEDKYPGSIEWARIDAKWPGRAALAEARS